MKPRKKRDVQYPPNVQYFKPQGIPMASIDTVCVTVDEYEAVRLADYEKLRHQEAAEKMAISRPTFTRLLESAHNKIGDAIINGKAIRIEGGDFNFLGSRYQCKNCGFSWNIDNNNSIDVNTSSYSAVCPNCGSSKTDNIGQKIVLQCGRGRRARFGHGWSKREQ